MCLVEVSNAGDVTLNITADNRVTVSSLSRSLARYAIDLSIEELPEEVVEKTKRLILDSVGCSIGAFASPPAKILRQTYGAYRSDWEATILGTRNRVPAEHAGLVNGLMGRYLDMNDIYTASRSVCHPSDHIPGLLAVAEAADASGEDLITSVVLAYEIECRGVDTGVVWNNGFDYVTWGAFSSAAAAGKLMGLSEDELTNAIGIAGTSSNALMIARMGELSMWKAMAHPYVTHNAIQACQMARDGMTGPELVFEGVEARGGEGGFFHAVAGSAFDFGSLARGDGEYRVMDAILKQYACAYFSHPAIYGALSIVTEHGLEATDIESIDLRVFDHAMQIYATPDKWSTDLNRETADHSLPYNVAVAVIDREVTPRQYDEDRLTDTRVHELMQRVSVEPDEELDDYRRKNPRHVPEHVSITTKAGETYEMRVNAPPGHPDRPMSAEDLDQKVAGAMGDFLTDDQISSVIDRCHSLEEEQIVDGVIEDVVV